MARADLLTRLFDAYQRGDDEGFRLMQRARVRQRE